MLFMAIASNHWGKGPTIAAAIRKCRDQSYTTLGDSRRKPALRNKLVFAIHQVPDDATVNGMGYITWSDEKQENKLIGYVDIDGKLMAGPDGEESLAQVSTS